jgi:NAD(P)H-hydrate epimerase
MKKGLSAKQIKAIDQYMIESIGMPSLVLMERAALATVDAILKDFEFNSALILCGTGNNGGDGVAVGRLLHQAGKAVTITLVGDPEHASEETTAQLKMARNLNVRCINSLEDSWPDDSDTLIVDALFGIGLDREVEDPYLEVIRRVNNGTFRTVSIDVPSGLSADTGSVFGDAIKADKTYSIGFWKNGFSNEESGTYTGEIRLLDIGYPSLSELTRIIDQEENNGEQI